MLDVRRPLRPSHTPHCSLMSSRPLLIFCRLLAAPPHSSHLVRPRTIPYLPHLPCCYYSPITYTLYHRHFQSFSNLFRRLRFQSTIALFSTILPSFTLLSPLPFLLYPTLPLLYHIVSSSQRR